MIRTDLHTHTYYCDGKDSPEDMVLSAIGKGLKVYGLSGHSYAPYDLDCCMKPDGTAAYFEVVQRLKEKYTGRIKLLCGIEQDIFADAPAFDLDYIIGSVHYVETVDGFLSIDHRPEKTQMIADKYFGGDNYALAKAYFDTVAEVVSRTDCDIVGHFDLISKFNENGELFNEQDPRYVKAWQPVADRIFEDFAEKGRTPIFEVNTGAISRGWRSWPYPSLDMMRYISAKGGSLILSSDAHSRENIAYQFDIWEQRLAGEDIELSEVSDF